MVRAARVQLGDQRCGSPTPRSSSKSVRVFAPPTNQPAAVAWRTYAPKPCKDLCLRPPCWHAARSQQARRLLLPL